MEDELTVDELIDELTDLTDEELAELLAAVKEEILDRSALIDLDDEDEDEDEEDDEE
jgi:hypothetical protein